MKHLEIRVSEFISMMECNHKVLKNWTRSNTKSNKKHDKKLARFSQKLADVVTFIELHQFELVNVTGSKIVKLVELVRISNSMLEQGECNK